MQIQAGTRLGTYEIVSLLGEGGMGQVYRAKDISLTRDVAIKVLPTDFAGDEERVARFQREAKARQIHVVLNWCDEIDRLTTKP